MFDDLLSSIKSVSPEPEAAGVVGDNVVEFSIKDAISLGNEMLVFRDSITSPKLITSIDMS